MAYLEWLDQSVQAVLAEKPAGTPVALRAYFQVTGDHGLLLPLLAQAVEAAARWHQGAVTRLFAQGDLTAGYVSVVAEFRNGGTGLITVETCRHEKPHVTLLIFGNRGTIRLDDSPDAEGVAPKPSPLTPLLERSLREGEPVEVGDGG